jgi:class 3 adenylate cyclase/tetratricopeptide (TPR) repeat protein
LVVAACRTCGEANAETARFCHACGGALDAAELAAPREVRKTVTILFADVAGSTALGEQLDPEALRSVMSRYYEEMRAVLEHHGGTVEKFIGDAVMAVFGAPVAHEDDALRAVRAADEMRNRLGDLNLELEQRHGVTLELRIGVNTGEVVAGDPVAGQSGLVTGDAVNLAKRLEQAAPAGSILIGKSTYPLVKDAVQAGPLESFSVKGKADPVSPLRLDAIDPYAAGVARELERRFVGRIEELAALQIALRRVEGEQGCRLFTILGPAGIGKSRLVAEFAAGSRATVLEGRCLPYGEGITLWPFREIVRKLGGAEGLATVLAGADDAELVVDRVMGAVGASGSAHSEETPWAFRRLFEKIAGQRPLVVVLEDVHWAVPAFLDLVEYLLGWLRGPVLVICLGRHDLVELRPEWLNPRPNADTLLLDPLAADEAESLLAELDADPQAKARIAEAAEGNPLFLEQMAALLAEEQEDAEDVPIPPSIQALLAARLDQLEPVERAVIERAAIVGREFSRSAVRALSPPELATPLAGALMALVRKKLLLPEASKPAHDDMFRFEHVLIRDAAYDAVPKQRRAELHERLADWLEAVEAAEELVGYHLEQAYRLGVEIAGDGSSEALRVRAADRLAAAGRKAFVRGDMPAAADLLAHAASLLPVDEAPWLELAPDLAVALRDTGELGRAEAVLSRAVERAVAGGDPRSESLARVELTALELMAGDPSIEEAEEAVERAVTVFTDLDDEHGLARAWNLIGRMEWIKGRAAAMEVALERGLAHARRAGNERDVASILRLLPLAALFGPRPVEDALERCDEIRRDSRGDLGVEAVVTMAVAVLEARLGRFDEARRLERRSEEIFRELGLNVSRSGVGMYAGTIELLAGDPDAAELELQAAVTALEQLGDRAGLSTASALLAKALCVQERDEDAERYAVLAAEAASPDDLVSQVIWRGVRAQLLARRGGGTEAERLAREAVGLAAKTDFSWLHGDALVALGAVQHAVGNEGGSRETLAEALRHYEAKGDLVSSRSTRALLGEQHSVELDRDTARR